MLLAIISASLAGAWATSTGGQKKSVNEPPASSSTSHGISRISAAVDHGELDGAESDLWTLLARDPNLPEGLNLLGIIRGKQQRYAEAEALFRRTIALRNNFLGAYLNLAATQRMQGNLQAAAATYESAVKIFPRDSHVATELAGVYLAQRQYRQSLAALEPIPPGSLSPEAFPVLITDLLQLNQLAQARDLVATAALRFPRNHHLRAALANVFLSAGMADEAGKILQEDAPARTAARGSSGDTDAASLYVLGKIQLAQGKTAAAEQTLQRSLRRDPSSVPVRLSLAALAAQRKQYPQALELLDAAQKLSPNSPEVLRDQVITSLRAGRNERASVAAGKLLQAGGENPENLFVAGVAALQLEKWDLAQRLVEQYLAQNPQDPRAHLALGIAYLNQQDLAHAQLEMKRCLELDPHEVEAEFQLAMVSRAQGNNAAAITSLEHVVAAQPRNARAWSVLGTLYLQAGDEAKAQAALERSAVFDSTIPETQYQLSLLYNRLGNPDRARQHLAQFHELQKSATRSDNAPSAPAPSEPR